MLTHDRAQAQLAAEANDAQLAAMVGRSDIINFLANIWPHDLIDCPKFRIGGAHDGGYVVPATALLCESLLSIGIGNDMQFDLELAAFGLKVLQFDHTIKSPPNFHENCHFMRLGLGPARSEKLLSFAEVCTILGVISCGLSILKFDIEGAEYDAFIAAPTSAIAAFDVIVCEYHDLLQLEKRQFFERAMAVAERFIENHVAVHLHPNNCGIARSIEGIPIPDVAEVTYIDRKFSNYGELSTALMPGALDSPNNPRDAELRPYSSATIAHELVELMRRRHTMPHPPKDREPSRQEIP